MLSHDRSEIIFNAMKCTKGSLCLNRYCSQANAKYMHFKYIF